eukprot:5831129-Prymnesium_polylepis.1
MLAPRTPLAQRPTWRRFSQLPRVAAPSSPGAQYTMRAPPLFPGGQHVAQAHDAVRVEETLQLLRQPSGQPASEGGRVATGR